MKKISQSNHEILSSLLIVFSCCKKINKKNLYLWFLGFAEIWSEFGGTGYAARKSYYALSFSKDAQKVKGSIHCKTICDMFLLTKENFVKVKKKKKKIF